MNHIRSHIYVFTFLFYMVLWNSVPQAGYANCYLEIEQLCCHKETAIRLAHQHSSLRKEEGVSDSTRGLQEASLHMQDIQGVGTW